MTPKRYAFRFGSDDSPEQVNGAVNKLFVFRLTHSPKCERQYPLNAGRIVCVERAVKEAGQLRVEIMKRFHWTKSVCL